MSATRMLVSLDGQWHLMPASKDMGTVEGWFKGTTPENCTSITLPYIAPQTPEALSYWLLCEFSIDAIQSGLSFHLDVPSSYAAESVWVNGASLAEGSPTVASPIPLAKALQQGTNRLALRIRCTDPTGRWCAGDIRIQGLPEKHIESVFVHPDIRRKSLSATITTSDGSAAKVSILNADGEGLDAESGQTVLIPFPEHEKWSASSPMLYTLRTEMNNSGEVIDSCDTIFAMREFTVRDERFYLNTRPFALKALDLSASTNDLLNAEALKQEMAWATSAGFNALRIEALFLTDSLCQAANECGLAILAELPHKDISRATDLIERFRNQPCIAAWLHPGEFEFTLQTIREIDPSRIVMQVPCASKFGSTYLECTPSYHTDTQPQHALHLNLVQGLDAQGRTYLQAEGFGEELTWVSHTAPFLLGSSGETEQDTITTGFTQRDLSVQFESPQAILHEGAKLLLESLLTNLDALRRNPNVRGYVLPRLPEQLDRDESRGFIADHLSPLRLLVDMTAINLRPREEAQIEVFMANEQRLEERVDLSLQVVGPTGQTLWKKRRTMKLPRHGKSIWSGSVSASGAPGKHAFIARLMMNGVRATETVTHFQVLECEKSYESGINVLDPSGVWLERCRRITAEISLQVPVHIIPPLANTIRAYPDNEFAQLLGHAQDGAVVILFGVPSDWNDLADIIDSSLRATMASTDPLRPQALHYAKLHPLFDGLPTGGLMGRAYDGVIPHASFREESEEDICGALYLSQSPTEDSSYVDTPWWGSNLLVKRFGKGRVVFCQLRILESMDSDPLAAKLFINLIRHFARRASAAGGSMAVHQKAVEWLRKERTLHTQRWDIVGMFSQPGGPSLDAPHPPETSLDDFKPVSSALGDVPWRTWHTTHSNDNWLVLSDALAPRPIGVGRVLAGTAYAYAEFTLDQRGMIEAYIDRSCPLKVWLNGTLVGHYPKIPASGHTLSDKFEAPGKQGRNTLLIKATAVSQPCRFKLEMSPVDHGVKSLWWR